MYKLILTVPPNLIRSLSSSINSVSSVLFKNLNKKKEKLIQNWNPCSSKMKHYYICTFLQVSSNRWLQYNAVLVNFYQTLQFNTWFFKPILLPLSPLLALILYLILFTAWGLNHDLTIFQAAATKKRRKYQ